MHRHFNQSGPRGSPEQRGPENIKEAPGVSTYSCDFLRGYFNIDSTDSGLLLLDHFLAHKKKKKTDLILEVPSDMITVSTFWEPLLLWIISKINTCIFSVLQMSNLERWQESDHGISGIEIKSPVIKWFLSVSFYSSTHENKNKKTPLMSKSDTLPFILWFW